MPEPLTAAERATLEQGVRDADRMVLLLKDPAFTKACAAIETRCTAEWRNAEKPEDANRAWATLRALDALLRELRTTISTGDLAQHSLKLDERRAERQDDV